MSEVNRFGIEPVESYLGYIVIEILDKHKKELIAEFLEDLRETDMGCGWNEYIEHLIKKWEEKAK